jgi:hypothetical protein
MTQEIVKFDPNFVNILTAGFNGKGLAFPFITEIQLMECYIAGTTFREDIGEIEPELQKDDLLVLKREPDNEYDKLAIAVYDKEERRIGYIPQRKNEILARLMDVGKIVFGKIKNKKWQDRWLNINILVYMRDM